jgi:hypothetical protein
MEAVESPWGKFLGKLPMARKPNYLLDLYILLGLFDRAYQLIA